MTNDCRWLCWCPGLALPRWREECRLVEERFSLFRPFAEAPFFGFRGSVARSGSLYQVTVAAEMDMYPQHQPWVFVSPCLAGANEHGKLCLDARWSSDSTFAMVMGGHYIYRGSKLGVFGGSVEEVCRFADGTLKTFNYVVANPPFSYKTWRNGFDPERDQYGRFTGYGIPPAKSGDFAFLLHILRSLKGRVSPTIGGVGSA